MNEDLYYEPEYDAYNCEPYYLEESEHNFSSIELGVDVPYNPNSEF